MIHSLDMYTDVKRDFINTFVDTVLKPRGWEDRKLQFTGPTGTNAVEAALKLARKVTGRTEVVAFNRGFHGMTLGALACTANNAFRSSSGVPLTNVIRDTFNDMEALENLRQKMFDLGSGMLPPAAFIVEPVQAEGGVRPASKQWLQGVQKLANDTGALFILDSIQCGCGRCGSYFSFDDLDVDPDIIILAKGLGGVGTPIGMLVNKPEFDKVWGPGQHTGTFRGQGFSFVAGKIALEYFKNEEFNEETKRKGEIIRETLNSLEAKYYQVIDVRQKGMMLAIEFKNASFRLPFFSHTSFLFKISVAVAVKGMGKSSIKTSSPINSSILSKTLSAFIIPPSENEKSTSLKYLKHQSSKPNPHKLEVSHLHINHQLKHPLMNLK